MHRPTTRLRRALLAPLLAALAIGPVYSVLPASAAPDGSGLVISEVYGAGGNSGATHNQDYVELYNPTSADIALAGKSIQYRSATGTANPSGVLPLTGTVPAGKHFLVTLATGSAGTPLPVAGDQTSSTINLSGSAGTVFLANQTTALTAPPTGSITGNAAVLDLLGYGTSNTFEGSAAPATTPTTASSRNATGADTDVNNADFANLAPAPENAGSGPVEPPPTTDPVAISAIQGTGATSPLAGQTATTRGVVTASYPTGGFRGFYIQTPGTGADPSSQTASDGLFVFLGSATTYPSLGQYVQVTGPVSEFAGLTEISPAATGVTTLTETVPAPVAAPLTWPAADADRERFEGMLVAPQGHYTVTDVYALNQYAEINLASGDKPLHQPTDLARPLSPEAEAVAADNKARAVTLDDGASLNYFTTGKDTPLPWLTGHPSIRVGAQTDFTKDVVLDFRNDAWKFQPTSALTAENDATIRPATFTDTRTAAPEPLDGDFKIASFNVLNFFKETGEQYVADGGTCSSYKDRAGTPITVNTCNGEGPRGAWDTTNQQRQAAKTVAAINSLGADVLGLMEVENSAKFAGVERRDDALALLVDKLNEAAGSTVWAYVPSPPAADQTPVEGQDVIRSAFIYKVAKVQPVGTSKMSSDPAFGNAREPIAQAFKPVGGDDSQRFIAAVNHFKSKGSGTGPDADQGDGQGASNYSRVNQAHALVGFVDQVKSETGIAKTFLLGDFNSYTREDPMEVLYDAGYTDLTSDQAEESTYVFDAMSGSLDHVLVNDALKPDVKESDVWQINSVESVAYEYSRYNYNATLFYAPNAYRSSDHDPLLVGFNLPRSTQPTKVVATVAAPPKKQQHPRLTAIVTAPSGTPRGEAVVSLEGAEVGRATLAGGTAAIELPVLKKKGTYTLEVRYLGGEGFEPSSTTVTYTVGKP